MTLSIQNLAWDKMNGLLPAIVQDEATRQVIMLGYMNEAALNQTLETKLVTFYSRKTNALWVKGDTSGNRLILSEIYPDCDNDTLLVIAKSTGPICHQGSQTCFADDKSYAKNSIAHLEQIIAERQRFQPEGSYVAKLLNSGMSRIAQKVGEEGVEVALAAVLEDKEILCSEIADLFFHVLVLLRAREMTFDEILAVLKEREEKKNTTCKSFVA